MMLLVIIYYSAKKKRIILSCLPQASSSMKQVIGAIRYFYLKVLNENLPESLKINLRKPIYLPVILSSKEVNKIINSTENLKHKTILLLIYSAGLRLGELLSLRIADIDSQAMRIHVR